MVVLGDVSGVFGRTGALRACLGQMARPLRLDRRAMSLRRAEFAAAYLAACRDPSRREEAEALGELVRRPAAAERRAED
jgi:hypothetical protein